MREARDRIELLDETLIHVPGVNGIPELLAAKAAEGCQIRVLYADPANHWVNHREGIDRRSDPDVDDQEEAENNQAADARALGWDQASDRVYHLLEPLIGRPRVEIREYVAARFNTVVRFDEQMLVTLHLWGQPTTQAPLVLAHASNFTHDGCSPLSRAIYGSSSTRPMVA
jgi:hypothetical protein